MGLSRCYKTRIFIRLEARLRPNIGNTLRARFDGVHAFVYNSAGSEPIWLKFGAPSRFWARSAEKRQRESKANFCHVSNARLHRFPVRQISRNLHTTRREWAKTGPP